MRNIDYRALYDQVCENVDPKKRKGSWDGLTHDERTKKEILSNKARTISVNQAKLGKGTGKNGVAPVAPPNLNQEDIDRMASALIDEGFAADYDSAITILEYCSDEWFNLLLDEQTRMIPNPSVPMPLNTPPKGVKSNMPIIPEKQPSTKKIKPGSPHVDKLPLT